MLKEKAGVIAGTIWNALNETEGMTAKQLKKATKLVDKDLFLGLGWLLREDKVSVEEVEGELFIKLIYASNHLSNKKMRWYIVIMLSTHFFIFRHLRIFAHQKDKIIRIQHEEYTQLLHYCSYRPR